MLLYKKGKWKIQRETLGRKHEENYVSRNRRRHRWLGLIRTVLPGPSGSHKAHTRIHSKLLLTRNKRQLIYIYCTTSTRELTVTSCSSQAPWVALNFVPSKKIRNRLPQRSVTGLPRITFYTTCSVRRGPWIKWGEWYSVSFIHPT